MQNKDSLKLFSLLNEGNIDEFRHTIQKYTAEELSEIKHPSTTQTLLSFILSKRQNINQIILNTKVLLTQTSGLGVNFPCKMVIFLKKLKLEKILNFNNQRRVLRSFKQ